MYNKGFIRYWCKPILIGVIKALNNYQESRVLIIFDRALKFECTVHTYIRMYVLLTDHDESLSYLYNVIVC